MGARGGVWRTPRALDPGSPTAPPPPLCTDFTNALIDKSQVLAMCRVADGVNPTTGADTRASLGCGSRRKRLAASPSNPDGPQVAEADKEAFRKTLPVYRS